MMQSVTLCNDEECYTGVTMLSLTLCSDVGYTVLHDVTHAAPLLRMKSL